jgi:hypothetical protein
VQIPDVRDTAHDGFAVELEDEAEHAVRGRMLRPDVDEHVLTLELRLDLRGRGERKDVAGFVDGERHALRPALGVDACGRELDFDRSLGGRHRYSPTRSPVPSRRFMSSGKSSKASAIDSSSFE